jgi:hypothetical protein
MKNLNKHKLQLLTINILIVKGKSSYSILKNLIGFYSEYYFPKANDYRNNFCDYNHVGDSLNKKLNNKYPWGILKTNYKQWLKKRNEKLK